MDVFGGEQAIDPVNLGKALAAFEQSFALQPLHQVFPQGVVARVHGYVGNALFFADLQSDP